MRIKSILASVLVLGAMALGQSQFAGGSGSAASVTVNAGNGLSGGGTGSNLTLNAAIPITNGASGGNICARVVNEGLLSNISGRAISAQNDSASIGTINDCFAQDLQTPTAVSTVYFGGGGTGGYRTCTGWHVGDRDVFVGDNTGKGGTGINANTGTNWIGSSTFPTCQTNGNGITVTGTATQSTVTFKLFNGSGHVPLIIQPGTTFVFNGDSNQYIIKNCVAGTNPPCQDSVGAGVGQSFYYGLVDDNTTTITVNITPALATSPSNLGVVLVPPIWTLGEASTTCQGCSAQDAILREGFINGDSTNGQLSACIGGFAGQAAQENTRFEDILVRNCAIGIRIFGAPDSGVYRNLNVAYNNNYNNGLGCPAPGNGVVTTIPFEFGVNHYSVDRATAFVDLCTAAQVPKGLFHITSNPISSLGGGTFTMSNFHGEMTGGGAGDMVLIDSTSGSIHLYAGAGCPSGFPCLNLIHVASTFVGTLAVDSMACNNGTTNYIKDDVNGNTLLCNATQQTGTDYYRIAIDGTASTDVDCAHMTKGYCFNGSGTAYFSGGVIQWELCTTGLMCQYQGVATVGTGLPYILAWTGATGVTIGSGGGIGVTQLCSTTICPAGLYEVKAYILITTACTTGGTYTVWINYTDSGGAKSSNTNLIPLNGISGPLASATLVPTAGTYASGTVLVQTTGAANQALGSINYGTTAGACSTGGPMVGKLFLAVSRLG